MSESNVYPLQPKTGKQAPEPIEPRIMLASDFWDQEAEPANDIVEGLIPTGVATMLVGRSGNGKSTLMQMLMVAASQGKDWLGRPVRKCKSFGLFAEDPWKILRDRQKRICRHYGIEDERDLEDMVSLMPNDDGNFNLYACFKKYEDGTERTLWKQIKQRCIEDGVELIILDNIRNIFLGDKFNDLHVNSFVRFFNTQARIMNCAIILIANPPKNRSSQFSGIQAWEDSFRHMISFSPPLDDKGKEIEGELRLRVEPGSNYLPYNHPLKRVGISLEWQDDVLVSRGSGEPKALDSLGRLDLDARLLHAVTHAVGVLGHKFAADPHSRNYLPGKLAAQKQWQHIAYNELASSLDRLLTDGRLIKVPLKDAWLIRTPDCQPYLGERE
jgi:energy-coupling factor transporter ATP-binding protein EcfA2